MSSLNLTKENTDRHTAVTLTQRAQSLADLLNDAVATHSLTSDEAQTMYRQWVDAQG